MDDEVGPSYLAVLNARIRTNIQLDRVSIVTQLVASPTPPWRPIASRVVARLLGVSIQSLANWRLRGTGPTPEPMIPGLGNRIYYRPDEIMAWLSGTRQWWEFSADWLTQHGVGVDDPSEATVQDRIQMLERLRALD